MMFYILQENFRQGFKAVEMMLKIQDIVSLKETIGRDLTKKAKNLGGWSGKASRQFQRTSCIVLVISSYSTS